MQVTLADQQGQSQFAAVQRKDIPRAWPVRPARSSGFTAFNTDHTPRRHPDLLKGLFAMGFDQAVEDPGEGATTPPHRPVRTCLPASQLHVQLTAIYAGLRT